MFMAACILGPVLGGVLTDYVHWSLIFWINLPLGAVALVMTDRALRRLPRNERPHRLDFIGAAPDGRRRRRAAAGAELGRQSAIPGPRSQVVGLIGGSARAVGAVRAAARCGRRSRSFRSTMLKEPVVFGIVVAGFFSIGTIIGLSIFIPLYIELVLRPLGQRLRPRADRLHGRGDARLDGGAAG